MASVGFLVEYGFLYCYTDKNAVEAVKMAYKAI